MNCACPDLCGGCPAMDIPTAIPCPEELRILHGNGGFVRWLATLARTDVLILDDWGLATLDGPTRSDLLEIIDDRAGSRATILTSQLPVEHWHAWIGDATIADAILDRLLSRSQRLALKGKSLRPDKLASSPAPDHVAAAPVLSSQTL